MDGKYFLETSFVKIVWRSFENLPIYVQCYNGLCKPTFMEVLHQPTRSHDVSKNAPLNVPRDCYFTIFLLFSYSFSKSIDSFGQFLNDQKRTGQGKIQKIKNKYTQKILILFNFFYFFPFARHFSKEKPLIILSRNYAIFLKIYYALLKSCQPLSKSYNPLFKSYNHKITTQCCIF